MPKLVLHNQIQPQLLDKCESQANCLNLYLNFERKRDELNVHTFMPLNPILLHHFYVTCVTYPLKNLNWFEFLVTSFFVVQCAVEPRPYTCICGDFLLCSLQSFMDSFASRLSLMNSAKSWILGSPLSLPKKEKQVLSCLLVYKVCFLLNKFACWLFILCFYVQATQVVLGCKLVIPKHACQILYIRFIHYPKQYVAFLIFLFFVHFFSKKKALTLFDGCLYVS